MAILFASTSRGIVTKDYIKGVFFMREKTVKRYYCDCGKGFFKKSSCLSHEQNCTSWKNPKNKSCKTCIHAVLVKAEYVDGYLFEPPYYECKVRFDQEHSGAPDGVDYISVNCSQWEQKP